MMISCLQMVFCFTLYNSFLFLCLRVSFAAGSGCARLRIDTPPGLFYEDWAGIWHIGQHGARIW
jgi:hypothetical protein